MPVTIPIPRRGLAALGLLLALVACGGGSAPATVPPATTAAPRPTVAATAPSTVATATVGAPTPPATATRATAPLASGTPPSATTRAATAAATATRGTPTRAATAGTPAATSRAYAPDDPCAPYAAGAVPPLGRAVAAAPARLCIPALVVSAPIIPVGVKADGAMDEPGDLVTVGWYAPGVPPGAVGNAVLDGKLDGVDGGPGVGRGVFWDLSLLRPGDLIVVVDEAGIPRRFRVLATAVYRREAAPLLQVFGETPDVNLNLITAAGALVPGEPRYDSNLIVFARLAP